MLRGNPYGTDSFPAHERLTRVLLSLTHGGALAMSFGWSGHENGVADDFREVAKRESGMKHATPLPWAALLVSEQTRQFYAYKDIAERWIPHVVGAFRAPTEEHLPLRLINDWDLDAAALDKYAVVMTPNAAALSGAQTEAVREYVRKGGGLWRRAKRRCATNLVGRAATSPWRTYSASRTKAGRSAAATADARRQFRRRSR